MTIPTTTIVRPVRRVRDLIRGKRFVVATRFPGGREIERAAVETRQRAFKKALQVNRPQTSPTAGGTNYDPDATRYTTAPYQQYKRVLVEP